MFTLPRWYRARRLILAGALAFGAAHASTSQQVSAKPSRSSEVRTTLDVTVTGLRNEKGRVAIALFTDPKAFPDQKRALVGRLVAIDRGKARVRFTRLPPGNYALAVLHDENENDAMDFNLLGMPVEGYGFSNDAHAMFGPPSFRKARFRVGEDAARHAVTARYFSF